MKQIKLKYNILKKIKSCYVTSWYDGVGSVDGGEPICPCCFHMNIPSDDFGNYICSADSSIEPSSKEIPQSCPLEDFEEDVK